MSIDVPRSPILVVDDNPTDVFFLQRRLTSAGIFNPLQHLEDGLDAVRWFEDQAPMPDSERPWLVFVDLKMPRMDGFELLSWMQSRGLTRSLTVAVLTTSDDPKEEVRALGYGADRFLVKYPQPVQLADLVHYAAQFQGKVTPQVRAPVN